MLLDPSRPEVSYLLGLLHTDGWHSGCVDHKGKVGIELHERDVAPPRECGLVSRAYLRGVLDGDGSVGFTRTGAPFVSLVTASEPMARFFEDQVWEVCGVRRSTRRNTRDRVFNVMVTNTSAALMAGHCW
ncbi:LAGLIDADG family homing endonuclease [Terrabacter sp. Root85]|uniref:LAGLIDADG family homing endonuclease n=2 Tax=unclassified Terrabacter TaxID=2630222 RepID=UPI0009E66A39